MIEDTTAPLEKAGRPEPTRRASSARRRAPAGTAFTLIELLVAVALLSIMMIAMTRLYILARNVTERSRDWSEYYAIARQETERSKGTLFDSLFIATNNVYSSANNPLRADYDEKGILLATNLASNAAPTSGAYYRAVSTYSLVSTGTETLGSRKLGIQVIQVYRKATSSTFDGTAVFQTTVFYTAPGV
jgi:prepilin-type N-terminal cleavage/methylation domain-containing protein